MNAWPLLLFLVTVALLVLPLVPALIETINPTDIAPLRVVQSYDNNPQHFALGFKKFITNHFGDLNEEKSRSGKLSDGTMYQLIGTGEKATYPSLRQSDNLIVSANAIRLPNEKIFESEIYSKTDIATGNNSRFRALLSENAMTIGSNCAILRWAHSDGEMHVGIDSALLGRATSNHSIILSPGCNFERLHAPKIITGEERPKPEDSAFIERIIMDELKDVKLKSGRRSVLEGNLDFPAYHIFDGDIVAGSTALIGEYAHIKGSVKSNAMNDISLYLQKTGVMHHSEKNNARCELGNFVRIDGAVISTHDLYIGEHCRIGGPVIAENLMVIRTGTIIGSPDSPCTVIAPAIVIETGCVIYGTLRAGKEGLVTVASAPQIGEGRVA